MVMGTVQGHIMGLVLLYFYLHILSSCIAIMASKPRKHRSSKTDNELETSKFELDSSVQNKISKSDGTKYSSKTFRESSQEDENEEVPAKGTQTAPSHRDQGSSTNNNLTPIGTKQTKIVESGSTNKRRPSTTRRPLVHDIIHANDVPSASKTNEMTTQADFEDDLDIDESHAETQTDVSGESALEKENVENALNNPSESTHLNDKENEFESDTISPSEKASKSDLLPEPAQTLVVGTPSPECDNTSAANECRFRATEYNDLEIDQLVGVAAEYFNEAKHLGWYCLSQCLDFMNEKGKDTCDPCKLSATENQGTATLVLDTDAEKSSVVEMSVDETAQNNHDELTLNPTIDDDSSMTKDETVEVLVVNQSTSTVIDDRDETRNTNQVDSTRITEDDNQ